MLAKHEAHRVAWPGRAEVLGNRSEEELIADLRALVDRGLLVEESDDEFQPKYFLP